MKTPYTESVLSVHHWTEDLFSFTTTRNPGLRFSSGHFTMVGLQVDGRPLLRAYSIASAKHEDQLEFFSIKVPNGPLTSRLQSIKPGDEVLIGNKPTGTLVIDYLLPGKNLYLLSTGTGLAPFLSIIKDPETYQRFETVVLVHGVRTMADLAYKDTLIKDLPQHPTVGEAAKKQLRYLPLVSRESHVNSGRITDWLNDGRLAAAAELPPLNPTTDRVMICGNPQMLVDLKSMLEERSFTEGTTTQPGSFVVERAFVS
jgi:ferredoxin/flavodoxin---NADP+ reductase